MAGKEGGIFLGGVLLGSAIGAIAGMVTDPRATRQVRRVVRKTAARLPEMARDASDVTVETSVEVGRQIVYLAQDFQEDWRETSYRLRDAAVAGLRVSRREYLRIVSPEELDDAEPDRRDRHKE